MAIITSNPELLKFETLVREHKSANHPLFVEIEDAAIEGSLTSEIYQQFAINIATRTMLSLPEIHACCIQASLDLDPLRTAYSVMTGAEEGGFGKPKEVHTVLMMNSLNYHGKIVFGLEPIKLQELMALVRLVYSSNKFINYLNLKSICVDIQESQLSKFIDTDELIDTCKRMLYITGLKWENKSWKSVEDVVLLNKMAYQTLLEKNVLRETIDYCIAQLDVLVNMKTGYLQGVGFAHEGLADGMINKMFRILYAQVNAYSSPEDFMLNVYPYFSAHGNYIDVYLGLAENSEGVEVTHAQRELEKLAQLDSEALNSAWIGANDFANRNARIWDGIMAVYESSLNKQLIGN